MSTAECQSKMYDRTVGEMSAQTGFSRGTLTLWVRNGILTAKSDGSRWLLNEYETLRIASTKRTRKKFVIHHHASSP